MSSQATLKRSNSSSSLQSEGSSNAAARTGEGIIKRRSSDNKGQGTFMQCGRHSNQWLFGDISFKETAKSLFGRKDSS